MNVGGKIRLSDEFVLWMYLSKHLVEEVTFHIVLAMCVLLELLCYQVTPVIIDLVLGKIIQAKLPSYLCTIVLYISLFSNSFILDFF